MEALAAQELGHVVRLVREHALLLQQLESSLLTRRVIALQVLLTLLLALFPPLLEIAVPAGHLAFQLPLRLAFEVGLGALPLVHDLLRVFQVRGLLVHPPWVPKLVSVQVDEQLSRRDVLLEGRRRAGPGTPETLPVAEDIRWAGDLSRIGRHAATIWRGREDTPELARFEAGLGCTGYAQQRKATADAGRRRKTFPQVSSRSRQLLAGVEDS